MDLQFVAQFMLENFDQTTISGNGTHFLARCLLCGDSKKNPYKKRFNLNWNNGVPGWHCWNCGRHGNFIEIFSIIKGLSYDDAKKDLFKWRGKEDTKKQFKRNQRNRDNLKSVSINSPKKEVIIDEDNFNHIIENSYGLTDKGRYGNALRNFYSSRIIPIKYKIYICHTGRYRNRIIIPIFNENNDVIYFQARRIPETMLEPKYDNPVSPKQLCIFNRHNFNRNLSIIVHEGLIDAFMVGDNGTSCLGKEISEDLISTLLKLTDKNVIIALDNDSEAYKALANFMNRNKFAKKVKYFLYPKDFEGHDDINSYVRENEQVDVYELITQNSVSYSTAYTKLSISKLLGGNRKNENNKHRKRLHKSQ